MITDELKKRYEHAANSPSDINQLLPILQKYTLYSGGVVLEAGVRSIISTWAFLAGKPKKLISLDWVHPSYYGADISIVKRLAKENDIEFEFRKQTTIPVREQEDDPELKVMNIENDNVDFWFIDTNHVYYHLKEELRMHSKFVNKYIAMHDTTLCGEIDGNGNRPGIWQAVEEFLSENPEWIIKEKVDYNNGLTVLERVR
jgi:hypothetical protein